MDNINQNITQNTTQETANTDLNSNLSNMSSIEQSAVPQNSKWSLRRQILYFTFFGVIILSIILYFLWPIIFPAPTCFDKKQNGIETGIDCGGNCLLQCVNEYTPLNVSLSKAYKKSEGVYDILVLIENKNANKAPKTLNITIDIYDEKNTLATSTTKNYDGVTGPTIPIYISNYKISGISKVIPRINGYQMFASRDSYHIRLKDFDFINATDATGTSRLTVQYDSPYKEEVYENLPLIVTLVDTLGNTVAVGETYINNLKPDIVSNFYMSWPYQIIGIEGEVKTINIIPISKTYVQ